MKKNRALLEDLSALRHQAETLLNTEQKKNVLDFSSSPEEMQRVIHELAVHQIELEMQQDELLQTRAELEENLECYTDLYDFAPLGYLTLTREGTIRQVNLTATKLIGRERSLLIGDRFGRFVSPEGLPAFNALLARVFSKREHPFCEVMLLIEGKPSSSADTLVSPDSLVVLNHTVRIDAVLSNDAEECRVVISDISMQKKIEHENTVLKARLAQIGITEPIDKPVGSAAPDFNHQQLNKVIHARIRFAALSYLYFVDKASFLEIKKQVRTTDGNLSVHMRMLESAEYIRCDKEIKERKPPTMYRITPKGPDAFFRCKASLIAFLGA